MHDVFPPLVCLHDSVSSFRCILEVLVSCLGPENHRCPRHSLLEGLRFSSQWSCFLPYSHEHGSHLGPALSWRGFRYDQLQGQYLIAEKWHRTTGFPALFATRSPPDSEEWHFAHLHRNRCLNCRQRVAVAPGKKGIQRPVLNIQRSSHRAEAYAQRKRTLKGDEPPRDGVGSIPPKHTAQRP